MCGIAGLAGSLASGSSLEGVVTKMTAALAHRGPDDSGVWSNARHHIALGHRRLSIIDLTAEGHQPMRSASGRYVIAYNGEIYNFGELRRELGLAGNRFRGRSDTEIILAGFDEWGIDAAIRKFTGMFAIALWDTREHELLLIRDRVGKKPLYFGFIGGSLAFASELKAIRCVPGFTAEIDRNAIAAFLRHNYVPAPRSIYRDIQKLEAGSIARFRVKPEETRLIGIHRYWRPLDSGTLMKRFSGGLDDAVEELETLLRDATATRMVADVPLGAFLSGGIDSSLVVAMMKSTSSLPIRTFTIGFSEQDFNEAEHARSIAQHLGTEHTEIYITAQDALNVIPRLPHIYDEPFADSSQIPTILVCEATRKSVTVALSGDGGDESFCGYSRYVWWRDLWSGVSRLPRFSRTVAARILANTPTRFWDAGLTVCRPLLPRHLREEVNGERLRNLADVFSIDSPEAMYRRIVSHYKRPELIVREAREPDSILNDVTGLRDLDRLTEHMMFLDTMTYLPDDILVKVDRASMAVALEVRAPLLDHRVLEFAARLPFHWKLNGRVGKWILKKILYKHVPRGLVDRPKAGFSVPIASWLRGPLRHWAEDLLSEQRLANEGYFDPGPIRRVWREHLEGRSNWHYHIWDILMFQAWLRSQQSLPFATAA